MSNPDRVLDQIDDVLTDWSGSVDSMRWRPDLIEEIDRRQSEELAAVGHLVAHHTDATFEQALDAVRDVNEHGRDSRGWPLCFEAMRVALAPEIARVLDRTRPEAHGLVLEKLTPSMISAFVQVAHRRFFGDDLTRRADRNSGEEI